MKKNKVAEVLEGLKIVDIYSREGYTNKKIVFNNGLVLPLTYEINEIVEKFLRDKAKADKKMDLYDYINYMMGERFRWHSDKRSDHQRLKPVDWMNITMMNKIMGIVNTIVCEDEIYITASIETLEIPSYHRRFNKKALSKSATYQRLIIRTNTQPSKIIITL